MFFFKVVFFSKVFFKMFPLCNVFNFSFFKLFTKNSMRNIVDGDRGREPGRIRAGDGREVGALRGH